MARELIDRGHITYMWQEFKDGKWSDGVTLQSIIDRMPTVDAVEVVHCKDCVHWDNEICKNPLGLMLSLHDSFCSYGERKSQ
jgi:hypothetical protein